ncbi:MAG: flagellar type III secretion system pore protein FliP [Planctomycetes bacterium]|nr:flagellar type III secretion system pore protein FliP [Planctomycetota bacterium]
MTSEEHGCSLRRVIIVATLLVSATVVGPAQAQPALAGSSAGAIDNPLMIPDVRGILPTAEDADGVSATLQILVILTVLTLIPSILIMMTSFGRILIVLALLRQAMAMPQLPPGQILLGLALFLTLLVMGPTIHDVQQDAVNPYLNHEISQRVALDRALHHLRGFMYRQIDHQDNHEDIYLFLEYAQKRRIPPDEAVELGDVPTTVLIPSFILSELKAAFVMGFRIYLPFLVIDMVIASILISMGMMMLPPVLISLPFKILLFVLADGWHLVVQSLLHSFV